MYGGASRIRLSGRDCSKIPGRLWKKSSAQMPQDGVIFSDGVEADYLSFDSGAVASISVAEEKARLIAA